MEPTDRQPRQPSPQTHTRIITARILTTAADRLNALPALTHPVTGRTQAWRMTDGWRDHALRSALPAVLDRVSSKWVRTHARAAALAVLPPATGTTTTYAARLRQLADNIPDRCPVCDGTFETCTCTDTAARTPAGLVTA